MAQPTAYEQFLLELVNNARLNPLGAAKQFDTGLNDGLELGTISSDPGQALAYNVLLDDAAHFHSQWMFDNQKFQHEGDIRTDSTGSYQTRANDRMIDAGYQFNGSWAWGENLGNLGTTGTLDVNNAIVLINEGLFKSPYHRKNVLNGTFREIGNSTLTGTFNGYNTLLITQNFALSGSDIFLTGVAFDDSIIDDAFYTVGEGLAQVSVEATRQSDDAVFTTFTTDSGGYQMALTPGVYEVSFKQNNQTVGVPRQIAIVDENIKLDLDTSDPNPSVNQHLMGLQNADHLVGSQGNDSLVGNHGRDTLKGNAGDDILYGGAGNDTLIGDAGDDILYGGAGEDRLYVASNDNITLSDTQVIGDGIDIISNIEFANLYGRSNDNLIDARSAVNVRALIKGEGGNDTLRGGENDDTLFGGGGNDILFGEGGNDVINGNGGRDRLYIVSNNDITLSDTQVTGDGIDTISNIEFANLFGQDGDNIIDARDAVKIRTVIRGEGGNDTLRGGENRDTLLGGNGNDVLFGEGGNDIIDGNGGTDLIYVVSNNNITLSDNQVTGDGIDTIRNIEFANLYGQGRNNLIDARNATNISTVIKGGGGNDTLIGSQMSDNIQGDNGSDILYGSGGNDILTGNSGSDVFVLESAAGTDTIRDFVDGIDYLSLGAAVNFSDLDINDSSNGSVTIVNTIDNQMLAILNNVSAVNITEQDFTDI